MLLAAYLTISCTACGTTGLPNSNTPETKTTDSTTESVPSQEKTTTVQEKTTATPESTVTPSTSKQPSSTTTSKKPIKSTTTKQATTAKPITTTTAKQTTTTKATTTTTTSAQISDAKNVFFFFGKTTSNEPCFFEIIWENEQEILFGWNYYWTEQEYLDACKNNLFPYQTPNYDNDMYKVNGIYIYPNQCNYVDTFAIQKKNGTEFLLNSQSFPSATLRISYDETSITFIDSYTDNLCISLPAETTFEKLNLQDITEFQKDRYQ